MGQSISAAAPTGSVFLQPATAAADGNSPVRVIVTVYGPDGAAMIDQNVNVVSSLARSRVVQSALPTDANGQVAALVTSLAEGTSTITARLIVDSGLLTIASGKALFVAPVTTRPPAGAPANQNNSANPNNPVDPNSASSPNAPAVAGLRGGCNDSGVGDALVPSLAVGGCFDANDSIQGTLATVRVSDYGATVNDAADDSAAIRAASAALNSNGRLLFDPGTYTIAYANLVANGRIINLGSKSNIEVDGQGAVLMVTGYDPNVAVPYASFIQLGNANNVSVHDLTLDWARPPYSQGTIIANNGNSITVKFDAKYPVSAGMTVKAVMDYFPNGAPRGSGFDDYISNPNWLRITQLAPQVIQFFFANRASLNVAIGDRLVARHGIYEIHAITGGAVNNLTVSNVTVHAASGMGLVLTNPNNVRVQQFNVTRAGGRLMSTTADGIHFTSPAGEITICNSLLDGMGDDGINTNGAFAKITAIDNTNDILTVTPAYSYAPGLSAGDTVTVYDSGQLARGQATLLANWNSTTSAVGLDSIPAGAQVGGSILSTSKLPSSVTVQNVMVSYNRARGMLLNSPNVLVDNCSFVGNSMYGLLLQSDLYYEGPGVNQFTVQNSNFMCLGWSKSREAIRIAASDANHLPASAAVNQNVFILGNMVYSTAGAALDAESTTNLLFADNAMTGLAKMPTSPVPLLQLLNVTNATLFDNSVSNSSTTAVVQTNCSNVIQSRNTGF